MDTGPTQAQVASGKHPATHQIWWLCNPLKNRGVKRASEMGSKIFPGFFHHSVTGGLGDFVDI
jgi:hypothetical protein